MTRRRATLKDRKRSKGRGVEAFFEGTKIPIKPAGEPRKTATFNLPLRQLDFFDEFIRTGKQRFRHMDKVGVGAVNKSAVLEELLNMLERDERLKENVLKALEKKDRKEGSRHDPRKTGVEVEVTSEGEGV